jgi:hypothetical protein
MLWFWSNCFFIFGLVVFSFLLHFSDSNKSICHCISSLFLRFKNLLYFSLLLLPHSVSFCLLILVLPLIFSRVQSVYIYIFIHIYCLYSGLFSLILRLTSMITLILFFIFCCFLRFAYVMFFLLCIFPLFCSCLHFPCFPFWIYITTSFWVSSFLLWL